MGHVYVQRKSVSYPYTIHFAWCACGCWFTLAVQCWSFYAVEKDQQCGTTKGSIVAKRCSIFINMHLVQSLGVQDSWLRCSYISCWTKTSRADLIAVKQHHRVSHDAGQQQQLLAQVTKTVTLNKDCCWSTADCCYLHRVVVIWLTMQHYSHCSTFSEGHIECFEVRLAGDLQCSSWDDPPGFLGRKYMKKDLLIVTQHSCCMLVVLVWDWIRPNRSALYYRSFDFSLTTAAHLQSNHSR